MISPRDDSGATTAEFVVLVPAIVGLFLVFMSAISIPLQQYENNWLAHSAIRRVAIGESFEAVKLQVKKQSNGASLTIQVVDGLACATVSEASGGFWLKTLIAELIAPAKACTFIYGY